MSRNAALAASAPEGTPATAPRESADLATARTLVKTLDTYYVDPIVGLFVPWLGDVLTSAVGAFVVVVAARRKVPPIVIARMLLNLGVDAAIGLVPFAGDVADVALKANQKNLALLEQRSVTRKATWKDWAAVVGAAALVIGLVAALVWLVIWSLGQLF